MACAAGTVFDALAALLGLDAGQVTVNLAVRNGGFLRVSSLDLRGPRRRPYTRSPGEAEAPVVCTRRTTSLSMTRGAECQHVNVS